MMREPKTSAQRKDPKKLVKRSQTPILTRTRNIFTNDKSSPLRIGTLNYSPYKRDYSKTGRSGRSARRKRDDSTSGVFKYHLEKQLQDLTQNEKNLQTRLDVLEKEQKSLHSLVRKSERHINEALKKAQDEEDKIFSLFLDVIKEKNIKIDLGNMAEEEEDNSNIENMKPTLNIKEVNTGKVLSNYLKSEVGEGNNNDLSWPMLALQRRSLMKE